MLKRAIQNAAGKDTVLIDSASSTAKEAKRILDIMGLSRACTSRGKEAFFVSDAPAHFKKIGERFLGRRLSRVRKACYGL